MYHLLLSCEHASNEIPKTYQSFFKGHEATLNTHRAWDIGAYTSYQYLLKAFPQALHQHAPWSRLLIELNRSKHHKNLFSEFTDCLARDEKIKLVNNYYEPYRQEIIEMISLHLPLIHIAVHSFTPSLNNKERNADIGLLYDPKRSSEKLFCQDWKKSLQAIAPQYKVRKNYPYQGKTDGLTTALRKQFSEKNYLGIELEINQKFFEADFHPILSVLQKSLKKAFDSYCPL